MRAGGEKQWTGFDSEPTSTDWYKFKQSPGRDASRKITFRAKITSFPVRASISSLLSWTIAPSMGLEDDQNKVVFLFSVLNWVHRILKKKERYIQINQIKLFTIVIRLFFFIIYTHVHIFIH